MSRSLPHESEMGYFHVPDIVNSAAVNIGAHVSFSILVSSGYMPSSGIEIANIHWIIEKAREFQKNIYFCFIDYVKAFDCMDHNKQWKILQEMGIPDHLTCLLRNLYVGQKATVRTGHGAMDWFQIGKGEHQSCICHPTNLTYMQSTSCDVLLKPDLENFENYFTSMWDECNCVVVWTFFGIDFLWDWNEN